MSKTITVYTTNSCAYCVMVKKWLQAKNLTYTEINLETNPEQREPMMKLSGQMAVPVVVVEDIADGSKEIAIGWNPGKLASAVASMIEQVA